MFAQSEKVDQVLAALLEARKNFRKVEKDRDNTRSKYATLDSVLKVISTPLLEQGLMVEQSMHPDSQVKYIKVITTVRHVSGQFLSWLMCMPVESEKCQGAGSAFSYAKRYALIGCFGLEQDDDDGNGSNYTLTEWRKIIGKCENEDDLKNEFGRAWRSLSFAEKDLVKEAYDKKLAELQVGDAAKCNKGFKPASKDDRNAVAAQVESQPKASPAPQKQDISNFD